MQSLHLSFSVLALLGSSIIADLEYFTDDMIQHTTVRPLRSDTVQLHARLLQELNCNFNNLSFCILKNNGGWSFKQSLLELVKRLTDKTVSTTIVSGASTAGGRHYTDDTSPNYFACADWGTTDMRNLSPDVEGVPRLQAFVFLPEDMGPKQRYHRQADARSLNPRQEDNDQGRVFYAGPVRSDLHQEDELLSAVPDFACICLHIDLRLSNDDGSKLVVMFGSISQTIEFLDEKTSTEAAFSGITRKHSSILGAIASKLMWPFAHKTNTSSRFPVYPHNQWMHFTLPIFASSFSPISALNSSAPVALSLYGHSSVCIDNIAFVATSSDNCLRSLTWSSPLPRKAGQLRQYTIFFDAAGQPLFSDLPDSNVVTSRTGRRTDRAKTVVGAYVPPTHQIITEYFLSGSFLFSLVIGGFVVLFLLVLIFSLLFGKRTSRKALGEYESLHKQTSLRGKTVVRSSSVNSLPTFTAVSYLLPFDGRRANHPFRHSVSLDHTTIETDHSLPLNDQRSDSSHLGSISLPIDDARFKGPPPLQSIFVFNKRRRPNGSNNSASPVAASSSTDSWRFAPPSPSTTSDLQLAKRRRSAFRASSRHESDVSSASLPNARLSLLLSINEDNELVLVPPNCSQQSKRQLTVEKASDTNGVHRFGDVLSSLSELEAEATRQEMAASVGALCASRWPILSSDGLHQPLTLMNFNGEVDSIYESETLPPYADAVHFLDQVPRSSVD